MPDIFIPLDTTRSLLAGELSLLGAYRSVSLDWYVKHRKELEAAYPDMESFDQNFHPSKELFHQVLAQRENTEDASVPTADDISAINARTKAYLAKHLFDEHAYYYVLRHIDDDYQKAVEVLGDYQAYFEASLAKNRAHAQVP
jgi:hypothetical protein